MSDTTIQEIKDRLNIVDVISSYIQVKRAGTYFKALCPFHNEKTASFSISPQRQVWHCFGCGEGGDVFSFVQKYENMEFRDVLKILADRAGVKLPEYHPQDKHLEDEKERLVRINAFAARFYHELLLKDRRAQGAREYLQRRGLNEATIKQWQVGYAPDEFHALEQALLTKKVPLADLVKAGVSTRNERGQVYDRFRDRVTFPIFNYVGDIVGFSARTLHEKDSKGQPVAKYVNSPETPVYNKSRVLFGLNFAKQSIRKQDEVVIVEGQMDCIQAHQAGFTNIVATSGTALTEYQLDLLSRQTKNMKFCFDADAAGLKAMRRVLELYFGKDLVIKVVPLVGAKDPDELIKKDPAEFARLVAGAPLFLDYYIEQAFVAFHGDSIEQKKTIAKELLPLIGHLSDPIELDHYLTVLSEKLGTPTDVLKQALERGAKPKKPSGARPPEAPVVSRSARSKQDDQLEMQVLGGMLRFAEFRQIVAAEGDILDFGNPEIKSAAEQLMKTGGMAPEQAQSVLAKEAAFMVESQVTEAEGNDEAVRRELNKAFALLRLSGIKRKQKQLNSEIKNTEQQKDKTHLLELNQQFAQLAQQRSDLEKKYL